MKKRAEVIYLVCILILGCFFGATVILINPASAQPPTAPAEPQYPEAVIEPGMVGISWEEPVSDGGSPIINYNIYRGNSPGNEYFYIEVESLSNYFEDFDVNDGSTYYYQISAENSIGEGGRSEEVSATPGPTEEFTTHMLEGYVFDSETSEDINDAHIEVVNRENKDTFWTNSYSPGYYSIEVPQGGYDLVASATGYNEYYEFISINGEDARIDIYLTAEAGPDNFNDGPNGYNNGPDNYNNGPDYNNNGDGSGDGTGPDGHESGDMGGMGDLEGTFQSIMLFGLFFIVFIIATLLTISVATVASFVRLGKIKKKLMSIEEQQQYGSQHQYNHQSQHHSSLPPPPPPPPPGH